jgi:hypothetical protein
VFATTEDKFREYRVAWQEIARYFEAAHLPSHTQVDLCGSPVRKLLVPIQKVYFIVERGHSHMIVSYSFDMNGSQHSYRLVSPSSYQGMLI